MTPKTLFLITAGTARLTRLITTDTITSYLVHEPLNRRIAAHLEKLPPNADGTVDEPAWVKYTSGLTCPWCVGFWAGAAVLAGERLTREHPKARAAAKFAAAALSLNLIAVPVASKAGDLS